MEITINGKEESMFGNPPEVGEQLPKFKLEDADGNKVKTADIIGRITLLSTVPDIDTPVCSVETRKFNQEADKFPDVRFLTVSNNTVEQQKNWCAAQGVANLQMLSDENLSLGYAMKLYLPNFGALARTIFIVDATGKIIYRQVVSEITNEPDYDDALNALKKVAKRVDD
ncbi:thiol peroxidase [Lentilactobacillus kefiri]|uniref:Redoxin domain-containing protein n=2 Tax=Lentilactobacillus kefiri TaxID=33962 RepID=A0A8E1RJT1_LENKE|nr:thiol peroxidase [Lentilactobacillus kefiri]KRM51225.1 redoxin domain-containing protein [Lentilactobacillus kefiri DSM 20587 = JCM 5818]MCJ2162307.1 thiol peroxidase [Lentilactobacillus kefiri]MCP9369427.1 thiol peroxidase [Lentilactobacillus kefiri]MDH5108889.1 thiol peroxidase [Lentilactobacillus kefiri]MDM7493366.1 thiol peroxidase [Lentilactobacillus kefiri]